MAIQILPHLMLPQVQQVAVLLITHAEGVEVLEIARPAEEVAKYMIMDLQVLYPSQNIRIVVGFVTDAVDAVYVMVKALTNAVHK